MTDQPTQAQIDQARFAGQSARKNGRGIEKCPLYGMGEFGAILAREWRKGWESA